MSDLEAVVEGIELPSVTLWTSGLFYKFGFGDGDLVRRWVNAVYAASHDRIWLPDLLGEIAQISDPLQRRLWSPSWHAALWELVKTQLLPLVPGAFNLQLLIDDDLHNPIRVHLWNGQTLRSGDAEPPELAQICAEVDGRTVLQALVKVCTPGYEHPGTSYIVWS